MRGDRMDGGREVDWGSYLINVVVIKLRAGRVPGSERVMTARLKCYRKVKVQHE